jgi:hypothetical protein
MSCRVKRRQIYLKEDFEAGAGRKIPNPQRYEGHLCFLDNYFLKNKDRCAGFFNLDNLLQD